MQPGEIERFLATRLRSRRLVGELSFEGPVYEWTQEFVGDLRADEGKIKQFAQVYPALFVYYLAGVAAHFGDGGELWSFVPFAPDSDCQSAAGKGFEKGIRKLGLIDAWARLHTERPMRYVSQVMFHALIPKGTSRMFLRRVLQLMGEGLTTGSELRHEILTAATTAPLPVPVLRFLRYGDDLALDYLDRTANLVRALTRGETVSAKEFGLPAYFDEIWLALDAVPQRALLSTAPRPQVVFDPWNGHGPELLLPATSEIDRWIVRDALGQVPFRASELRERSHELSVASYWVIEGRSSGKLVNRHSVKSLAHGSFFFNSQDDLPLDGERFTGDEVVAILPPGCSVLVNNHEVEDDGRYPPLTGDWSSHSVRHLELVDESQVEVVRDGEQRLAFRTGDRAMRASLFGRPLQDVYGPDGIPVFDGLPLLQIPKNDDPARWFLQLDLSDGRQFRRTISELRAVYAGSWSLDQLLCEPLVAELKLRVSGPLGGDLEITFAVVSGLNFERLEVVADPTNVVSQKITAHPRVVLSVDRQGELIFNSGEETRTATAACGALAIKLQFYIPRLVWAVGDAFPIDGFEPTTSQVSVEDFLDRDSQLALWVRTGIPTEIRTSLRDVDGRTLQETGWQKTSRRGGRRRLDLRVLRDTIRQSEDAVLTVHVEARGGAHGEVVQLRRRYEVDAFEVDTVEGGLFAVFNEITPMRGRVLRLWDVVRPWTEPTELPIDDDSNGASGVEFCLEPLTPSGYVAELTVVRAPKEFPGARNVNTATLVVDTGETGLDDDSFLDAVTDFPTRALILTASSDEAAVLAARALQSVVALVDPPSGLVLDDRLQRQIETHATEALFDDASRLVRAVISEHQKGVLDERVTRLAMLQLLPSACDFSIEDEALTPVEYADLWEVSPLLAVALDRPSSSTAFERWRSHAGWVPDGTHPYPGHAFRGKILGAETTWLREKLSILTSQRISLLRESGFEHAIVHWLLRANQDFSAVEAWRAKYSELIHRRGREWPTRAQADYRLLCDTRSHVLRLPADLLAIGLHLVSFTDPETVDRSARRALAEAMEFAPRIVERQVAVAIIHHLIAQGSIMQDLEGSS